MTCDVCAKKSKVVELLVEEASVDEGLELVAALGRLEHSLVVAEALEDVALVGVEEAPQLGDVLRIGELVVHTRLRIVLAHDAVGRLLDAERRLARLVQVLERHVAQLAHIASYVRAFGVEYLAVTRGTERRMRLLEYVLRVAARYPVPVAGVHRPVGL